MYLGQHGVCPVGWDRIHVLIYSIHPLEYVTILSMEARFLYGIQVTYALVFSLTIFVEIAPMD